MKLLIKCCVFEILLFTVFGKSLYLERNAENSSEVNGNLSEECDCDWRYLKHYEVKGCQVEEENSCGCPKKFICPLNNTSEETKVCKYQNKEYSIGSKIITNNVCQVCRCRDGLSPHISCIPRECPQLDAPQGNCHYVYKKNRCCPVRYECVDAKLEERSENRTSICEYGGKFYPFGSKIYPEDDPCEICECDEHWTGINNSSCHQQECLLERRKPQLDEGCIPVYHENRCCPIEFYCPSSHNLRHSLSNQEALNGSTEESGDHCVFAGRFYQIGEELNRSSSCIRCKCQIPPDLTCVHQSCPSPPNSANCYAHHNPEECCPHYECLLGDEQAEMNETISETVCPTPQCADANCHIETPPGHQCPTCVCKQNVIEDVLFPEQNVLEREQEQDKEIIDDYFGENEGDSNEYFVELQSFQERPQKHDENLGLQKIIQLENREKFDEDQIPDLKHTEDLENANIVLSDDNIPQIEQHNLEEITDILVELHENNNNFEANDIELQRTLQKRSERSFDATPSSPASQQNLLLQDPSAMQQQQDVHEFNEKESETSEDSNEDYDTELESFREKLRNNGQKDNEISDLIPSEDVTSAEIVPDGCPTPMCADSTCKIEIPPGHRCPTCICKGSGNRQP